MLNVGESGERVATAIGAIKWVLIAIAGLVGAVSLVNAFLQDMDAARYVAFALAGGALTWSLLVWVLFGWFEHTLMMLVVISRNTTVATVRVHHDTVSG